MKTRYCQYNQCNLYMNLINFFYMPKILTRNIHALTGLFQNRLMINGTPFNLYMPRFEITPNHFKTINVFSSKKHFITELNVIQESTPRHIWLVLYLLFISKVTHAATQKLSQIRQDLTFGVHKYNNVSIRHFFIRILRYISFIKSFFIKIVRIDF